MNLIISQAIKAWDFFYIHVTKGLLFPRSIARNIVIVSRHQPKNAEFNISSMASV